MIIQVTGASTRNKGAELMLATVREHFGVPHSNITLAVNAWFGSLADRQKYNLAYKLEWKKWGRTRFGMMLTSKSFRESAGLFGDRDVDAVVDISGFAFGDQLPARRTAEFARQVVAWKRAGKKIVLLPQALGPFENLQHREAFGRIVASADLICARDEASLRHIEKHFGKQPHVILCPDITIGLPPAAAGRSDDGAPVLIVPNSRMLDKSDSETRKRYIPFLQACIRAVRQAGRVPQILLHDAEEDRNLVPELRKGVMEDTEVIDEPDPIALKTIISQSQLVIGSRFHALVSALSSAVPVLATGWSHKYQMLLADFGCPDRLLRMTETDSVVNETIQDCLAPDTQNTDRENLRSCLVTLTEQTTSMWRRVDEVLAWRSRSA